jgi:arginyl-tRNA synthetase
MQSILETLKKRFTQALIDAFDPEMKSVDPLVKLANNPQFGDYQADVAMSLAKKLKQKPREIAQQIINHLQY